MSQKVYRFLMFLALLMIPLGIMATTNYVDPAEWHNIPSLFFKSWSTNRPIPVMATDGYRLPVEMSTSVSIGTVPVAITTQFVATDSANRYAINIASVSVSSVPAKITNWNEMPVYPFATDSSNRLNMNIASVTVSSLPTNIINWSDMPFNPAPPYATNTSDMLRVSIATAEIFLASPITLDDASRTVVNIGSYSTVIPASITNFPATTELVTNSDNELIVAISSQSSVLVASISNLPEVQQLKVDADNNLTVNVASVTGTLEVSNFPATQDVNVASWNVATIGVTVDNLPAAQSVNVDGDGTLQVNISSSTATVNANVTNFPSTQTVNVGQWSTTATIPVSITNLATGQTLLTADDGVLLVNIGGMSTTTPLIASISNLPAGQDVRVDASGSLVVKMATDTITGVQVDQNTGYIPAKTPSFNITNTAKYNIGAEIGTGTKEFILYVYNGSIVVNNYTDLATGGIPIGTPVASGSYFKWEGNASSSPNIWGMAQDTFTTTCVLVCW